jgi:hypothetical protein
VFGFRATVITNTSNDSAMFKGVMFIHTVRATGPYGGPNLFAERANWFPAVSLKIVFSYLCVGVAAG